MPIKKLQLLTISTLQRMQAVCRKLSGSKMEFIRTWPSRTMYGTRNIGGSYDTNWRNPIFSINNYNFHLRLCLCSPLRRALSGQGHRRRNAGTLRRCGCAWSVVYGISHPRQELFINFMMQKKQLRIKTVN